MRKVWNPQRRRFLRAAAAAGVAGSAISCGCSKSPWRVLKLEEGETAAAICERLIPADELPGARWAGAVDFLDRQLYGHLRKHREAYAKGLAAFERSAREKFGKRFVELAEDQQVQLLREAEKAKDPFFALILSHTMQSYYGDPRHGGNRDEVGYRSLGIPPTIVRGRSRHDINKPGAA
jgi:gluconate 2-dehydrogenase gamma chain